MVKVKKPGTAEIYISYQGLFCYTLFINLIENLNLKKTFLVYCATWRPCYDIRASTSTAAFDVTTCENDGVSIFYYGLIEQKTDEDWKDAEIVLSTAVPTFAGVMPTLPTLTASFQRQQQFFFIIIIHLG